MDHSASCGEAEARGSLNPRVWNQPGQYCFKQSFKHINKSPQTSPRPCLEFGKHLSDHNLLQVARDPLRALLGSRFTMLQEPFPSTQSLVPRSSSYAHVIKIYTVTHYFLKAFSEWHLYNIMLRKQDSHNELMTKRMVTKLTRYVTPIIGSEAILLRCIAWNSSISLAPKSRSWSVYTHACLR